MSVEGCTRAKLASALIGVAALVWLAPAGAQERMAIAATPISDGELAVVDTAPAEPAITLQASAPASVTAPVTAAFAVETNPAAEEFSAILAWLEGMTPLVERFNTVLATFEGGGGLIVGDRAAVLAQLDRLAAQARRAQPEVLALRESALGLPAPPTVTVNPQLAAPLGQVVPGFVRQVDALYLNTQAVIAAPAALRAGDRLAFESAMRAVVGSGRLVLETERARLSLIDAAFSDGRASVEAAVIDGLILIVSLPELVASGRWPGERERVLAAIARAADAIELAARDYRTGREAIAPLLGVAPDRIPPVLEGQLDRFRLLTEPTAEQRVAEVEIANALRGVHDRLARAGSPDDVAAAANDPLLRATIARRDQVLGAAYRGG